ncbi:MAG: ATP-binding cassette domain-containing protein [Bryobacterales bacterium]|nr:ATP-binding cassette domain-containing protein [Bryobacterales bacterium]
MPTHATERPCILRLQNISLAFGEGAKVLDNVSLEMRAGETKIILGAAGAGKSVMLKVALGLLKPTEGRIFLFGHDVTDYTENQWYEVRSHIGVLFQEGGLFDSLTIEENVAYPLVNRSSKKPEEVHPQVEEALRFVELGHTLEKFPSELSGGMRRRVGIARAGISDPALLLYDSPTAGLDPITANNIMSLIIQERETRNATSAIVTHRFQDGHIMANFRYNPDSKRLERIPDDSPLRQSTRFVVMRDGQIVFEGSEAELDASTDPYIAKFSMQRSAH